MDLTPSIEKKTFTEWLQWLQIKDLEYQQLLNRAILNAHKTKENGNNNSGTKRNG